MVTYPEDWKEFRFKDTGIEVSKGQVITRADVRIGEIPVVAGGMEPAYYCDKYNRDGFTVTISASGANAGYVNLYKGKIFASDCSTISEAPNYDVRYIYYLLLNKQNEIYDAQTGGAQPHIHPKDIYKLPIVYTSNISEQQAIASALSDFDEHIDNLSDLIEKKKAIRDGALENLISGRTRLDGFNDEWIESTIEDSTKEIITGGTPSTTVDKYWGGSIPWLASTEIHQKIITRATKNITNIGLNNSSAKMAPKDSVLIALAGQGKTRGTAAFLAYPMALNQSLAALVAADETDSKFLYYLIENMYLELRELSSGDGGRGGLNKTLIKNINIRLPREIKEQHAIAEVLTAMDEEIESLKIEKEKMIQIKEGAMDDLLTGRVRLKV